MTHTLAVNTRLLAVQARHAEDAAVSLYLSVAPEGALDYRDLSPGQRQRFRILIAEAQQATEVKV